MGFSPGDFYSTNWNTTEAKYHWEAKDKFMVLWDEYETNAILRLTYDEAKQALDQLRTAIYSATGEDPV